MSGEKGKERTKPEKETEDQVIFHYLREVGGKEKKVKQHVMR